MSGSGKAGNGRGNNRKRFRRRGNDNKTWQEADASQRSGFFDKGAGGERKASGRGNFPKRNTDNPRLDRAPLIERPKWVPPKINTEPLPVPDCSWCGKPIRDIFSAIADKDTGAPLHFDCVAAKISAGEILSGNETVVYIGGGRFGIVNQNSQGKPVHGQAENSDFRIKKIIEWENRENKAEWRSLICEHYSVT